jgi:FG-GAP repeat/Astacin (Peptidase family M12A)
MSTALRSVALPCLLVALGVVACTSDVDRSPPAPAVGVQGQASLADAAIFDRWYGVNAVNRVHYFLGFLPPVDPADPYQHRAAVLASLQTYNGMTAIDFQPAPVVADPRIDGGSLPDPNDEEPHVIYVDVDDVGWPSQALTLTSLTNMAATDPGHARLLNKYGPTGNGALRPADTTTHPLRPRHEDMMVAFGTTKYFGGVGGLHVPLHETGHIVGLQHEQNRPDRCKVLEFFPGCADPALVSQDNVSFTGEYLAPYDITSIMQYGSTVFCKMKPDNTCLCNPLMQRDPTVPFPPSPSAQFTKLDQCRTPAALATTGKFIEQTAEFSPEDLNTLYQMYPPPLGRDAPGDHFGASMATGDFDGDGYTDLAVGVPSDLALNGHSNGSVYLYKGTFTGLIPWKRLFEPGVDRREGDRFGASVTAGRLHPTDTTDAIVIGAPGRAIDGIRTGAVYVFTTTVTPTTITTPGTFAILPLSVVTAGAAGFLASAGGDGFGETLAMGDFNGDGKREIVVGAPNVHTVYVVERSGGAWTQFVPSFGAARVAESRFGAAFAVGDLDDDGNDDLAIGAPGGVGRVFVARGDAASGFRTLPSGDVVVLVEEPVVAPDLEDAFGTALAIGRFRPDVARRSLAVGAPGRGGGAVFLFAPGMQFIANDAHVHTLEEVNGNAAPNARFGARLAAGDLDGTGGDDLAVGAPHWSHGGLPQRGLVAMFRGRILQSDPSLTSMGASTATTTHGPAAAYDHFGSSLAIGDFDKQGIGDLAVGQPGRNEGAGAAWILIGRERGSPGFVANEGRFTTFLAQGDPSDLFNTIWNYRR